MKLGVEHLALGAAAFGGLYWLLVVRRGSQAVVSGTVTLEARVPYRLTLDAAEPVTAFPMNATMVDRQTEIRTELLKFSAYDVAFGLIPNGSGGSRYVVSFKMTPLHPLPLIIGAELDRDTKWGPKLTLSKVERLDGKNI